MINIQYILLHINLPHHQVRQLATKIHLSWQCNIQYLMNFQFFTFLESLCILCKKDKQTLRILTTYKMRLQIFRSKKDQQFYYKVFINPPTVFGST